MTILFIGASMKKTSLIDSHVHLDLIERYHSHRIQWLMDHSCGVLSWAFVAKPRSIGHLEAGLLNHAECVQRLSATGMECAFLSGIHPRSIPPTLRPEQIETLLAAWQDAPLCLGIGEIGLETGTTLEKEVFIAQLEWARCRRGKSSIVGIHTPRANKRAITKATLKILSEFTDLSSSIVVDHCRPDTIGSVLASGFRAGVTLSPSKTSSEELKGILTDFSDCLDRIMCNTDSGSNFHEDMIRCIKGNEIPQQIRENIFHNNAGRWIAPALMKTS
jgi:predicted metal-dependent TIM-barrel fold hydrolase